MSRSNLKEGAHVVYDIHLHVVLVTKYRHKVLTDVMFDDMRDVTTRVLGANRSTLEELNGEPDHVHLLIDLHSNNNISNLVSSIKSLTSRMLRAKYRQYFEQYYWGDKAKLWHDAKCIVSLEGTPLEVVKQYIQEQSGGDKSHQDCCVSVVQSRSVSFKSCLVSNDSSIATRISKSI